MIFSQMNRSLTMYTCMDMDGIGVAWFNDL